MALTTAVLRQRLDEIGKTLDGDYVVSVELEDGTKLDEVYIKQRPNGTLGTISAGTRDRDIVPVDPNSIRNIQPCPYRVADSIAMEAWKRGESGMGYFRLNVVLRDGRELRNIIAARPYVLPPYRGSEVVRVEHLGFH
jgi:hypothetical protein